MALDKTALALAIKVELEANAAGKTAAQAADGLADAIEAYVTAAIATVTIPALSVVTVPGTGGALNALPITVVGDPDATTGGLS